MRRGSSLVTSPPPWGSRQLPRVLLTHKCCPYLLLMQGRPNLVWDIRRMTERRVHTKLRQMMNKRLMPLQPIDSQHCELD